MSRSPRSRTLLSSLAVVAGGLVVTGVVAPSASAARGIDVALAAYGAPNPVADQTYYLRDLVDPVKTPVPPAVVVMDFGANSAAEGDAIADQLRARIVPSTGEHVQVLGYVDTAFLGRPVSDIQHGTFYPVNPAYPEVPPARNFGIDDWLSPHADGLVHYDGVFFDQMQPECGPTVGSMSYRDTYRSLRTYVWNKVPEASETVIGNPGQAFDQCYLEPGKRTADSFVSFEGPEQNYQYTSNPNPPGTFNIQWFEGNLVNRAVPGSGYLDGRTVTFNGTTTPIDSSSYWHIVYNGAGTAASIGTTVDLAFDRFVGHIEDTTDRRDLIPGGGPFDYTNPFDAMSTSLNAEIAYADTKG